MSPRTLSLGIALLFIAAAHAQSEQAAAPNAESVCSVKQQDNNDFADSKITFSGQVRSGEVYRCRFIRGFEFRLEPSTLGWIVVLSESDSLKNLSRSADSSDGVPIPLLLRLADLPQEDSATDTSVFTGRFSFSAPSRGDGSVTIKQVKWIEHGTNASSVAAEVAIDVSIDFPTMDGIPLYEKSSGAQPPKPVRLSDPEYSKEARKAKLKGTVVLWLIVAADGTPRNIKVVRTVGLGLDEKAIEAVRKWRFNPGTKDGNPVPTRISVQVDFHLR